MTREKQIDEFANSQVDCEFFNKDLYEGIIIDAKWADEHPNNKENMVNKQEFIKRAKTWVKNCFIGTFSDGVANNIANEFEKYMEG